jgi:hypothetical protein
MPRRSSRKKRPGSPRAPALDVATILAWADEHRERLGSWPTRDSGAILEAVGETWYKVDKALRDGTRTLPGGSSLARLLAAQRGARNRADLPRLTVRTVLAWADDHFHRTGDWPCRESGPVACAPGEKWANVDAALVQGLRGLPGGSSLARLLARHRRAVNLADRPALSEGQVLAWADAHRRRTGGWPTRSAGPIPGSSGDTWLAVDTALHRGTRGLPGGSSLARLLAERRGARNRAGAPPLTEEIILAWADAHRERTGRWPGARSGPVLEAPGETWGAINKALRYGHRALPAGPNLVELLVRRRGLRNNWHLPRLSQADILRWADAHFARTGSWPTARSGVVEEAPEETWQGLDGLLRKGRRGLPGGFSLARLLAGRRPPRERRAAP